MLAIWTKHSCKDQDLIAHTSEDTSTLPLSTPTESGGDLCQNRLDDVSIVVDAELIRNGQEQRISRRDGFILCELLDKDARLGGIAATENCPGVFANQPNLIFVLVRTSK